MSDKTVLIAGFSGRALAASARRAGYLPLVADAFADTDTRELSHACEVLPGALHRGFRLATLSAALDRLTQTAPTPPIGLILAAGFEDEPSLVTRLAERYRLIGCSADTIRAAKDPERFFSMLADLGIAHPETQRAPPADGRGWLTKRIGGSGGTHIARCRRMVNAHDDRYVQREMAGAPLSMTGLVGKGAAFAFASPWVAPMPRRPFRHGGLAGSIDLEADLEARLIEIGIDVSRNLGLKGLVSFDLILAEGMPHLIEVNPRPGAALDIFDDEEGTLFKAHVLAASGEDPTPLLAAEWRPRPRASACLYADDAALEIDRIAWPEWVSDRPAEGTVVARHDPVATVRAVASSAEMAATIATERLGELRALLYGQPKN
ncbi:MAG: ATP-grasp domain-containing protein [Hyphomicrobiaceae bacterium]